MGELFTNAMMSWKRSSSSHRSEEIVYVFYSLCHEAMTWYNHMYIYIILYNLYCNERVEFQLTATQIWSFCPTSQLPKLQDPWGSFRFEGLWRPAQLLWAAAPDGLAICIDWHVVSHLPKKDKKGIMYHWHTHMFTSSHIPCIETK